MGSEGLAGTGEGGFCRKVLKTRTLRMNREVCSISLKCNLPAPPTSLPSGHIPNTPEILNTIVSITTMIGTPPQLTQPHMDNKTVPHPLSLASSTQAAYQKSSTRPPDWPTWNHMESPSKSDSIIQDYRSQFIKEGLKMKVKKNLKMTAQDSFKNILSENIKKEIEDQSPEDEVRRRRRRERNKVAAEKCRIKKKKETMNLFSEREIVERANAYYKEEIAKLEAEQGKLIHILANHRPSCTLENNTSGSLNCWKLAKSDRYANLPVDDIGMGENIKEDTEDVVMVVDDYSLQENKDQRSEYLSQSCTSYSNRNQPVTSYTNLAYQGYSFTSGYYYDSTCAVP